LAGRLRNGCHNAHQRSAAVYEDHQSSNRVPEIGFVPS
jgi:hypothetical protein